MKKKIAICMAVALMLTSCGHQNVNEPRETAAFDSAEEAGIVQQETVADQDESISKEPKDYEDPFTKEDPELLTGELEQKIYDNLLENIDSDTYFVKNVQAVYLSKEYLEELQFNSMTNLYFGYSLSDLDSQFVGTRYVFSPDEYGKTAVRELVAYEDEFEQEIMKEVIVGTGVIVLCVTISTVATAGTGTVPSMSVILSAPATEKAIEVLGAGLATAVAAGIAEGIRTGDMEDALEKATVAGAQDLTWNAVAGYLEEDASVPALIGDALNGLSEAQGALIQKETGYPLEVIRDFNSMDFYQLCRDAGLFAESVEGEAALIQDVDLQLVDEGSGKPNLQKMQEGEAPLDATGKAYRLYRIGKDVTSTIAMLAGEVSDDKMLTPTEDEQKEFWKALAVLIAKEALK